MVFGVHVTDDTGEFVDGRRNANNRGKPPALDVLRGDLDAVDAFGGASDSLDDFGIVLRTHEELAVFESDVDATDFPDHVFLAPPA